MNINIYQTLSSELPFYRDPTDGIASPAADETTSPPPPPILVPLPRELIHKIISFLADKDFLNFSETSHEANAIAKIELPHREKSYWFKQHRLTLDPSLALEDAKRMYSKLDCNNPELIEALGGLKATYNLPVFTPTKKMCSTDYLDTAPVIMKAMRGSIVRSHPLRHIAICWYNPFPVLGETKFDISTLQQRNNAKNWVAAGHDGLFLDNIFNEKNEKANFERIHRLIHSTGIGPTRLVWQLDLNQLNQSSSCYESPVQPGRPRIVLWNPALTPKKNRKLLIQKGILTPEGKWS